MAMGRRPKSGPISLPPDRPVELGIYTSTLRIRRLAEMYPLVLQVGMPPEGLVFQLIETPLVGNPASVATIILGFRAPRRPPIVFGCRPDGWVVVPQKALPQF